MKLLAVLAVVGAFGLPQVVSAQEVTCQGVHRLSLSWFAKRAEATLFVAATKCTPADPCNGFETTRRDVLTRGPITLTITDAVGRQLQSVVDSGRILKRSNCPGGYETHQTREGRFTYVFGNKGMTTISGLKLKIPTSRPPDLTPPLNVRIAASNGYAINYELPNCFEKIRSGSVSIRCSGVAGRVRQANRSFAPRG